MAFDNSTFPYQPPVVGVTLGPTYGVRVNQILNALISAVRQPLTPAQLNLNATTDFQNQHLISLGALDMFNRTTLDTTYVNSIQAVGGELFFVDGAGRTVQITVGGAINAAAVGGITGDYGGAFPASVVAANQAGNFYSFSTAAGTFSFLKCLGLIMTNNSGNTAQLSAPSSLSNHTATWFSSLPGAGTKMVTITSAGVLNHGAAVDAFSLNANNDITLSGTGKLKHGNYEYKQSLSGAQTNAALFTNAVWVLANSTDTIRADLANGLVVGARIVNVRCRNFKDAVGTTTFTLNRVNADGSLTVIQTATNTGTGGAATTVITPASPEVITQDVRYYIRMSLDFSDADTRWFDLSAVIDQN